MSNRLYVGSSGSRFFNWPNNVRNCARNSSSLGGPAAFFLSGATADDAPVAVVAAGPGFGLDGLLDMMLLSEIEVIIRVWYWYGMVW